MADELKFSTESHLALTEAELEVLQDYLNAHDRGGYYMVYNAMTDSDEGGMRKKFLIFLSRIEMPLLGRFYIDSGIDWKLATPEKFGWLRADADNDNRILRLIA